MKYLDRCAMLCGIYSGIEQDNGYQGTGYSNIETRRIIHEYFPQHMLKIDGDNWYFCNTVPQIGEFLKKPQYTEDFLLIMPHKSGDYFQQTLDSLKPLWKHLLVIDQSGLIPQGEYGLLRTNIDLTFTQLQNWMMMFCRKKNIPFMGFAHSDIIVHDTRVWERILWVARNTTSGVVLSNYDTLSLWNVDRLLKAGFYDEQFRTYYGDVDLFNRIRVHDILYSCIHNHKVEHKGSSTIKTSSPERQAAWHLEVAKSKELYIEKWGGHIKEETFVRPYGVN